MIAYFSGAMNKVNGVVINNTWLNKVMECFIKCVYMYIPTYTHTHTHMQIHRQTYIFIVNVKICTVKPRSI